MKISNAPLLFAVAILLATTVSCKRNDGKLSEDPKDRYALNTEVTNSFFASHPEFKEYAPKVMELYEKDRQKMLWYDRDGRIDFAEVLYDKARQIEKEGVPVNLPYRTEFEDLFDKRDTKKPTSEDDLMISSLYVFYVDKVFAGLDQKQSRSTGWYLPRQKVSYVDYLDTLMKDPDLLKDDKIETFSQYDYLRKALGRYREIEKKGGWPSVSWEKGKKSLKKGDSDPAVAQVRKRLAIAGYLSSDSGSREFDTALEKAIVAFNKARYIEDANIDADLVKELNIPVQDRIKTIVVNMERCRWIPAGIENAPEYVAVNIPAYHMRYIKDGSTKLESNVVVGKELNKTVVFSGKMTYLVFSPYWNIPKSIAKKEIEPGIAKDPDYLEKHNMERNGENYRQKPGGNNSLGLVKFMFPNTNNIYLHDTPAKSLFNKEDRALSHGCVRVEKAKQLAYAILEDDSKWNEKKIDAAMHSGEEKQYPLGRKIPVYIAYFTAVADKDGNVAFFDDVYDRDPRLASLLYN